MRLTRAEGAGEEGAAADPGRDGLGDEPERAVEGVGDGLGDDVVVDDLRRHALSDGVGEAQHVVLRAGVFGDVDDVPEQRGHIVSLSVVEVMRGVGVLGSGAGGRQAFSSSRVRPTCDARLRSCSSR